MQISHARFKNNSSLMLVLLSLLFAVSCSNSQDANSAINANQGNVSTNTANANSPKDNVEELEAIVKLPLVPDENEEEHADWREETVESKGKKLTAVLKYNPGNAEKIIASAEKYGAPAEIDVDTEEWFPEELNAKAQLSGNESLKGVVYEANDFFNPPYTRGRMVRVKDTDYFILELTTY
jgi:hypothetical protein